MEPQTENSKEDKEDLRRKLRITREEARVAWFGEHEVGDEGYKEKCLEELADHKHGICNIKPPERTPKAYENYLGHLDTNHPDFKRDAIATIIELRRRDREACHRRVMRKLKDLVKLILTNGERL